MSHAPIAGLRSATVALVALAWLLPNHYPPWLTAWPEGVALAALALAALLAASEASVPRMWMLASALAGMSVVGQWWTGKLLFAGDALMVLVYLGAFVLALALGSTLAGRRVAAEADALDALGTAFALSAIVSVGVALVQWTGAVSLGVFGADLPPTSRPFANLGQPNHFNTAAFVGLCAAAWLHAGGRLGRWSWRLTAVFLVFGMAMSGSRTGWVQVLLAVGLVAGWGWRRGGPSRLGMLAWVVLPYAAFTLGWAAMAEFLMLGSGRGLAEQIDGGARIPLWRMLLDALASQPLWGYGWNQVSLAQQAAALDHPPLRILFEHSHNIVLDLLLWAGIPVGTALVVLAARALWLTGAGLAGDERRLWLFAGAMGIVVHGSLEFALEHAYFLVPCGLMLGAAAAAPGPSPAWRMPRLAISGAGAALLAIVAVLAVDYLKAEENYRALRMESARIGAAGIDPSVPALRLLDQLEALLRLARSPEIENLDEAQLARIRAAATRYPSPPAMLRHALAAGLNGHPDEAVQTLGRLCALHRPKHCQQSLAAWSAARARWPVLPPAPAP